MTTGEDIRRGATEGDLVTEPSPQTGNSRTRVFPPVTDHVDTDEIPAVAPPRSGSTFDANHPYGEDDSVDPRVDDASDDRPSEPARPGGAPAEGSPTQGSPTEGAPAHRPRPAGPMIVIAMMTVLLLAASALIAYLWRVADAWQERAGQLTEANYSLGTALADTRDTLTATEAQLDLVTQQLNASKDSVSRLQAENAQWGDDAAYAQEQIAGLQGLITEATTVSGSLSRCIEGHDKLVEYMTAPEEEQPKPKELRTFRESVDELCAAANDSYLEFQQSVAP